MCFMPWGPFITLICNLLRGKMFCGSWLRVKVMTPERILRSVNSQKCTLAEQRGKQESCVLTAEEVLNLPLVSMHKDSSPMHSWCLKKGFSELSKCCPTKHRCYLYSEQESESWGQWKAFMALPGLTWGSQQLYLSSALALHSLSELCWFLVMVLPEPDFHLWIDFQAWSLTSLITPILPKDLEF